MPPPPGVRAVLKRAERAHRERLNAVESEQTAVSGTSYSAGAAVAVADEPRVRVRREPIPKGKGLPGWLAVVVMGAVAGIGGLIDNLGGSTLKGLFAIGLILGSLIAIVLVRRAEMFPVIVAPPLIYFGASAVLLYIRGGFSNKSVLIDSAMNWLVYGFPAIAGASAVVLVIAGVRLITRK